MSKRLSNIYLNSSPTEQNWGSQNFSLVNSSLGQFLVNSNSRRSFNFKTFCCTLKTRGLGAKGCVVFLLL